MYKIVKFESTKKGYPAIWEQKSINEEVSFYSTVFDSYCERLTPIFTNNRQGSVKKSLFKIEKGYFFVDSEIRNGNIRIDVFEIVRITKDKSDITIKLRDSYNNKQTLNNDAKFHRVYSHCAKELMGLSFFPVFPKTNND